MKFQNHITSVHPYLFRPSQYTNISMCPTLLCSKLEDSSLRTHRGKTLCRILCKLSTVHIHPHSSLCQVTNSPYRPSIRSSVDSCFFDTISTTTNDRVERIPLQKRTKTYTILTTIKLLLHTWNSAIDKKKLDEFKDVGTYTHKNEIMLNVTNTSN